MPKNKIKRKMIACNGLSYLVVCNHGAGKYRVSCGPVSQYLPKLCPFIKTTPLVQSYMSAKVSIGSPSILKVPLNRSGDDVLFTFVTVSQGIELLLNLTNIHLATHVKDTQHNIDQKLLSRQGSLAKLVACIN